jgi:ankyrin repeat protein
MKNIYKIALLLALSTPPLFLQGMENETVGFSLNAEETAVNAQFEKIKNMFNNEQSTFEAIQKELTSGDQTREILTFHNAANQATLLHWLMIPGKIALNIKLQLLNLFIQNGADIDAKDINDFTPLFLAIDSKEENALIKALLEHNADPNIKNNQGQSSFYRAIEKERKIEELTLLLDHGADINTKDENQCTPLFLAIKNYAPIEIIKFLLENGADVNVTTKEWDNQLTPLFLAALKQNKDYIELLLEYGADPSIPSHYDDKDHTVKDFLKEKSVTQDEIDQIFATQPDQEKIAAAKKRTTTNSFDPTDPQHPQNHLGPRNSNETSWSTASKVGISTLIIATTFAGYYGYKRWQAKKKADQKKKEIKAKFTTPKKTVATV